jgi:ferrous iron transport protein B
MNAEMKSAKWLWGGIALQLSVGFTVGFLVYQCGTLITAGTVGAGFLPGLIAIIAVSVVVTVLCIKADRGVKKELAAKRAEREAKKTSV